MPFSGENKRQKIIVLLTMCFALFMAMLDNTVVNVALPTLSKQLGAGVSGLQWIVDGYVLAFASLLLTGGILGDRYGRKKLFMFGLGGFTIASLLCGLSGSTGQLIAFRGLQGIGGALLIPGTLAIITVTFPPRERAQAIGIWAGVSGIALALGPTLGGYMVQHIGWQSVFFLNIPIGLIGLVVAWRTLVETRAEHARSLDIVGLLLGTGSLFSLTYALIEANSFGWSDPLIVAGLTAGGALLTAFILFERRSPKAMMPMSFFKIPAFSAGNAIAFSVSMGMFGMMFFLTLYMQNIRGYSAFDAGLRFLPMTGMIVFAAPNAGRVAGKRGSRLPMVIGLSSASAGMFLMSQVTATTPFILIVPMMMMMGLGVGSTMTPMTAAVMNAVGHERAGLGSATTNTSREVGGVFGIALLGTLLTTQLKTKLTGSLAMLGIASPQATQITATAGHGQFDQAALTGLTPVQANAVAEAYRDAFLSGLHLALLVAGAVLLAAVFVAWRWIPSHAPAAEPHAVPVPAPAK